MSFSTNFVTSLLLAVSVLSLVDATNETSNETWGRRDCAVEAVSDVCHCEHHIWFKGMHCSKCKDKFKWGYGCDLDCAKDRCPYGCDMSGNCNVPSSCKQNNRAEHTMDGVVNEHGECQACESEYHGRWCTKKCPRNCDESSEGHCTRGGKCYACTKGFYGRECDKACPKNCPDCVFDDNLIKAPDGQSFLPAGTCKEQCKVDNYGSRCNQPCPANCAKTVGWFNVKRIPSCKKEDGHCFACEGSKWYGDKCENKCSSGCEDGECHKATGLCKDGCKNGFFGGKCDKKCSSGCKGGGCDKEDGKCDDGCNAGWRGDRCDEACTDGTGPDGCDRETGQPESCVSGRFPFKNMINDQWICKSCPDNCNNNKCDNYGQCTEGCEVGFYGGKCMSNCGSHCIGACDKTATGKTDGHCTECDGGYTGSKCNKKCHPTCSTCLQQRGGWGSGDGATGEGDCVSCDLDEPVEWKDGFCKCIEDATRDPKDHKCYCDEPVGEKAKDKMARFELRPRKRCRIICQEGMREVHGGKESMCLNNAVYKAVLVADAHQNAKQGKCKDGENEYDGECLKLEFVDHIVNY